MALASQNKRKTNHEPNEEDRNKLAIGYRLILVVLVSVFAVYNNAAAENRSEDVSDIRRFSKCEMVNVQTNMVTRDNLNGSAYSGLEVCVTKINLSVLDEVSFGENLRLRAICKSGSEDCIEKNCEYPSANFTQRSSIDIYLGQEYKKPVEKAQFANWIKNFASCKAGVESISKRAQGSNKRDAIDNSARQARQMCEAQKQSCKASCPAYNYDAKSFEANRTHFQCESRCSQISCN